MTAYYNENDGYAAQWLRNLIAAGHLAPGDVDERSIADVHPGTPRDGKRGARNHVQDIRRVLRAIDEERNGNG